MSVETSLGVCSCLWLHNFGPNHFIRCVLVCLLLISLRRSINSGMTRHSLWAVKLPRLWEIMYLVRYLLASLVRNIIFVTTHIFLLYFLSNDRASLFSTLQNTFPTLSNSTSQRLVAMCRIRYLRAWNVPRFRIVISTSSPSIVHQVLVGLLQSMRA